MTIIQIFSDFLKKRLDIRASIKTNKFKILSLNPIIFLTLIVIFSTVFFSLNNLMTQRNIEKKNNIKTIAASNEFSKFTNFVISKLNSPYSEIRYLNKSNDSIEKILKKYQIKSEDINEISTKLKRKKLSNIYSGRELSMVLKKLDDETITVINLNFPITNTSSVEVRKLQDTFTVKENILKLYKKEIVVKNSITNNLYSSAMTVNVEPNIIVEFARIFGFEVDFQRDIRKGDWFEIYYEKFIDDNNKVRDTGKIIYASMYVNGEEINLYNFEYKNDEEYYDI